MSRYCYELYNEEEDVWEVIDTFTDEVVGVFPSYYEAEIACSEFNEDDEWHK